MSGSGAEGSASTPAASAPTSFRGGISLTAGQVTAGVGSAEDVETAQSSSVVYDDPATIRAYQAVRVLDQTELPRGGVSVETAAVGRIQFGIPPETIKDSMRLGLGVPSVYIVPVDRFCTETGPALGVNLAEFEFPAYFNFFVQQKRCTLIVDSNEAERSIREVFSETLLGPEQFRREKDPITFEDEDFDPDYPPEMMPNFEKEFRHFRIMPNGKELVLETLLKFRHFQSSKEGQPNENIGIPPEIEEEEEDTKEEDGVKEITMKEAPEADDQTGPTMKTSFSMPEITAMLHADDTKRMLSELDDEDEWDVEKPWTFSSTKWIGDVATVYPDGVSDEDIAAGNCKRAEIFKMPGGQEYILHDIDENNAIVGKARFSGNVEVHEFMSVDGFGGKDLMMELATRRRKSASSRSSFSSLADSENSDSEDDNDFDDMFGNSDSLLPPTFYPPSFGVTVLGNSHGFDKQGSTSGYVLWINGRGVMIDPPPYSTATLGREGIRPGTIVGMILTHCHADHDAGAFQKILTDSRVAVITTPTIYKSFIRKYAALSELSPSLLRHSHRHIPAIIGTPLRFQGATFHFTYTLHTIPCVGFRVDWRGRSMVFTGDHFNSPPAIDKLEETGVLSKMRANDLRHLPLQETDLLLHEAGAPPIHTPLDVLLKLPPHVKKHLYVVHTSALPEGCELRVAPTGTAGTIRLDEMKLKDQNAAGKRQPPRLGGNSIPEDSPLENEIMYKSLLTNNEYEYGDSGRDMFTPSLLTGNSRQQAGTVSGRRANPRISFVGKASAEPPLVSMRPPSSTDAWFILNLLSAVPFITSLSYAHSMEVLESARVDAFCINDIVVPMNRRTEVLCVVWEGTCMERDHSENPMKDIARPSNRRGKGLRAENSMMQVMQGRHKPLTEKDLNTRKRVGVWQAGDWTGPRSLQPEKRLSGESSTSDSHDIVAMSKQGVKAITIEISKLHLILKDGSPLYRRYLSKRSRQAHVRALQRAGSGPSRHNLDIENINVMELIESNSALAKLSAVQKRHLESLTEGPVIYNSNQPLWNDGDPVDKAFLIVAGTVSFVPKHKHQQKNKASEVRDTDSDIRRDRFADKLLARLHGRQAISSGVSFSRGHFLGDISKMVTGLLADKHGPEEGNQQNIDDFHDAVEDHGDDKGAHFDISNHEQMIANSIEGATPEHESTLLAGKNGGCVVMYFPKSSLVPFLDKYPGFLLSLLGTQVVV
uniref:Metallo-beta-lactamase domain-containing protein n=1 Tax=Odontella aurita TaxID=265563 RepID=A0A7S4JWM8_9STRA|mmetsp:Transcript_55822/g.167302  ORF Transcript_55822/g.167302 Transcript_55822/m.167302 type:complete len:1218 (+) Transcript_55822:522-4175(+)|eukprot:CAMPEP_0113541392 /NCGR_PEP_ID=MMETSP0015_2-20120614/9006_1 /TAXON_ID=2838 /ORGANISM="Odontella" /LENGTH=1217 /DNA_ID=CAMNT_0000441293 /DNA_START=352 /DNA_END=4005 /DNA_ORIENTATION=- /assembly_acc=CAM_ASM_000160